LSSGQVFFLDTSPRTISLDINPDGQKEGEESFTVELYGAQFGVPIELAKPVAVVTILDPIPIPTLDQWALALLMLLTGWLGYHRLSQVSASRN